MIQIENTEVMGWKAAIRGMRNPKNSWGNSDSIVSLDQYPWIGKNDYKLAKRLADAGPVHGKYLRMITVYADITAPLYWWKEYDTYKVGTVANSCSTMHRIHTKEFTLDDFSHEHLLSETFTFHIIPMVALHGIIACLNQNRKLYLETKDKKYWWQMIQLLPSSYNQRRTVMLNYAVLADMYQSRKDHKLDEWHTFCHWVESLPYCELITGKKAD